MYFTTFENLSFVVAHAKAEEAVVREARHAISVASCPRNQTLAISQFRVNQCTK